jgi:spore maturation protein CgeB
MTHPPRSMSFSSSYPRILIAAELWYGSTGAGVAQGFRDLGWDVVEIDPRDHFIMGRMTPLRVAARLLSGQSQQSYNAEIVNSATTYSPTAFLTVKGNYLSVETLRNLRSRGIITAMYYPDFHFDHPGLDQASFKEYDLFFTTKSFQLDYLRSRLGEDTVRFLHHGYCSLVHRPRQEARTEEDYVTDVLYVGNYSPFKQVWLERISALLSDVRLMIVGNSWTDVARKFGPNTTILGHHVLGDGFARLLESARINVAVHFGPTGPNDWEDLVSIRTFEIPACKGFMLHIDSPEIRTLFTVGSEIGVFSDPEDLCRKIRYYLDHPDERIRMVNAAYRRCVPHYSYNERARTIASAISSLCTGKAQVLEIANS